jgi:hypothetical protein
MSHPRQSRAVSLALRCYPKRWRDRHAAEAKELARLLALDGVPVASICWDYLGGAARARLAPLFKRRWSARAAAVLAVGSIAATSVVMSISSAPAGALGVVRVEVDQRADAAAQLRSTFHAHGLDITVREVPVPARQAGSIVGTRLDGPQTSTWEVIGQIRGLCANGSTGCIVGLVIPANFNQTATVLVGQGPCSAGTTAGPRARPRPRPKEVGLRGQPC